LDTVNPTASLSIDAAADRQPIHPEIYGVTFAMAADLKANNSTLNRHGGDFVSRYDWKLNASNHTLDWYFESRPEPGGAGRAGAYVDAFIENTRAAGATAMVTIPINGWAAKRGPGYERLWSYSIRKYGPQAYHDPEQYLADAGNGIRVFGHHAIGDEPLEDSAIDNNDPTDASEQVTSEFQSESVKHLVQRWGNAANGGVRYYLMDSRADFRRSISRWPRSLVCFGTRSFFSIVSARFGWATTNL
jgi:hypothetical protein